MLFCCCGEAGIFAAYELAHLPPELKVLALDQARTSTTAAAPLCGEGEGVHPLPRVPYHVRFGGAGAFSDGKFILPPSLGLAHRLYGTRPGDGAYRLCGLHQRGPRATTLRSSPPRAAPPASWPARPGLHLHLLQAGASTWAPKTTCASSPTSTRASRTSWSSPSHRGGLHPNGGGRLPAPPGQGGEVSVKLPHRRTGAVRGGVVLQPVQGPGFWSCEQPGGFACGGAAPVVFEHITDVVY